MIPLHPSFIAWIKSLLLSDAVNTMMGAVIGLLQRLKRRQAVTIRHPQIQE
jgi:hypothetical protein